MAWCCLNLTFPFGLFNLIILHWFSFEEEL
jgi:hypothetical protein